jgi:peroxiredoxin
MRIFILILLTGFGLTVVSCKSTSEKGGSRDMTNGKIIGEARGEADSVYVYKVDGMLLKQAEAHPVSQNDGAVSFEIKPQVAPGFYQIGFTPEDSRKVLLGADKKMTIKGSVGQYKTASLEGSELNDDLKKVEKRLDGFNNTMQDAIKQYRAAMGGQGTVAEAEAAMTALDDEKITFLDSLKTSNPLLSRYVGLRTYITYQGRGKEAGQPDEPSYFRDDFFQYTDLTNPYYNSDVGINEQFKNYTYTLGRIGLSEEEQINAVKAQIAKIPDTNSSARKLALIGALAGFQQGKVGTGFLAISEIYSKEFPLDNPALLSQLSQQAGRMRSSTIGAEAPEIEMETPEGEMMKLSDLRGKYVLIDFWASWCGPCRRENPNVKKVYSKYKDKGFEILGVSLDRDKSRWIKAIEADGLPWPHVSDLRQWKNEAAQTYGVSSIPYTVLVDPEGKIVATRLRGASLEAKLAEVFGG